MSNHYRNVCCHQDHQDNERGQPGRGIVGWWGVGDATDSTSRRSTEVGGAVGMLRAGLGGSGQVPGICDQLIHQDTPSRPPLTPKITIIVHPHTGHRTPNAPRPPAKNVISDHYATLISNFDIYGTAGFITASTDVEHANNNPGRALGFLGVKILTPPPL